jgi:bla regulator protein blaR1
MSLWMFETFLATTALMLVVLAIRGPVAARFGARAAYLLWLAPALRMVMPPLPEIWSPEIWSVAPAQQIQEAVTVMTGVSSPAGVVLVAPDSSPVWPMLLIALWLGGAGLFFMRHILAYRRFVRTTLAGVEPFETREAITFSASPRIASPLALGIIGKAIIVPHDFNTRFNATEQRLALAHELTHHRRGDPGVNLLALAMLALHWFNPIAHIAHRAFRLDQEAACDAIVLNGATPCERQAYGSALFKAAIGPVPIAICAMATTTTLKARLRHIIARADKPERMMTGAALALAVIGGGLALTASTSFASDTKSRAARVSKPAVQDDYAEARRDAKEAREEARQAKIEAEQALVEAELEAQTVIREAEADVRVVQEEARAAAGDSKERMAQAQERVREAQIEADLTIVEAKRALAEARRNMVEPPAPPAPPAAPDASELPAAPSTQLSFGASPGAAPALQAKAAEVDCPKQARRRQIVSSNNGDNQIMVITCDDQITALTNATTRAAMNNARAQIMAMKVLGEGQRAAALKSLEAAIAKMRSRRFTLQ